MRHIALGGMSFCGSTVTSYVLGSLSGCANAGESHWLKDLPPNGKKLYCSHCGPACPILSENLRDRLAARRNGWYAVLAEALGAEILISSDKAPALLDELDANRNYDLVVLYKPPELHARSYVRAMYQQGRAFQIGKYLDQWSKFYGRYLDKFAVGGQKFFVDAQVLYAEPARGFAKLCDALGLVFDEAGLNYWLKIHHTIGGNFNPYSRLGTAADSLRLGPLPVHPVTDDLLHDIEAHRESQQIHARLRAQRDSVLN